MNYVEENDDSSASVRSESLSKLIYRQLNVPLSAMQDRRLIRAWRDALEAPIGSISGRARIACGGGGVECEIDRRMVRSDFDTVQAPGRRVFNLWIELEERCNVSCLFCYNPWRPSVEGQYSPRLSKGKLINTLSIILAELDVDAVTLSGGEPLMYPYLIDVVNFLAAHSLSMGITTNGRSGTRERLKSLATSGVSSIVVSLHSHQPDTHNRLVSASAWHAAVRTLALARELRFHTSLTCVLTRYNIDDIDKICDLVEILDVQRLILNYFHATGQGLERVDELKVGSREFRSAVERARLKLEGRKVEVVIGAPDEIVIRKEIRRITLSPFGDIKFCNESLLGVLNVENSRDVELIKLLADLRDGDHEILLTRIDRCTCAGR